MAVSSLLDVARVGILVQSLADWLEEERGLVDDADTRDKFLEGEGSDGNHCEAAWSGWVGGNGEM